MYEVHIHTDTNFWNALISKFYFYFWYVIFVYLWQVSWYTRGGEGTLVELEKNKSSDVKKLHILMSKAELFFKIKFRLLSLVAKHNNSDWEFYGQNV